jgi:hypothetical protein
MVVVPPNGMPAQDVGAIAQLLRSLPPMTLFGWLVSLPGVSALVRLAYRRIADNRIAISESFGMGACGVPRSAADAALDEQTDGAAGRRWFASAGALVGSVAALVFFVAVLAQTERHNQLPISLGLAENQPLIHLATWPRITARWGVLAPEPPKENGTLITNAETRDGAEVDVLTGYPPDLELTQPRRARKGQLWAAYSDRIRQDDYSTYRKELRRYLTKGGYALDVKQSGNYIRRLEALWLSAAIPPPGQPRTGEVTSKALFSHRGRPSRLRGSGREIPKSTRGIRPRSIPQKK